MGNRWRDTRAGWEWLAEGNTGSRAGLTRLIQGRCGEDTEQSRANEGEAGQVRRSTWTHKGNTVTKPKPRKHNTLNTTHTNLSKNHHEPKLKYTTHQAKQQKAVQTHHPNITRKPIWTRRTKQKCKPGDPKEHKNIKRPKNTQSPGRVWQIWVLLPPLYISIQISIYKHKQDRETENIMNRRSIFSLW